MLSVLMYWDYFAHKKGNISAHLLSCSYAFPQTVHQFDVLIMEAGAVDTRVFILDSARSLPMLSLL